MPGTGQQPRLVHDIEHHTSLAHLARQHTQPRRYTSQHAAVVLGRQVALKVLAPQLASDPSFRQRFIRESRAAAAVDDPHIIPLYEADEDNGVLFLAMRFVGGGDLRSLIRQEGPLPASRAAEIVSQVASVLDVAHDAGLVHRDVKPGNMLLDERRDAGRPDHVYLTDFGIAVGLMNVTEMTDTGQFLGTLNYSAPEQIESRPLDGRTDQYALACSAFEFMSGAPPFSGHHGMAAVVNAHMSEPPPKLSALRPGLPVQVDAVLARALVKDPASRYRTCMEFADALVDAIGFLPGADSASGAPEFLQTPDRAATRPAGTTTGLLPPLSDGRRDTSLPTGPPGVAVSPQSAWPAGVAEAQLDGGVAGLPPLSGGPGLVIPLKSTFRYVHEPCRSDEDAVPSLGNEALATDLKNRILHSRGGSFLITGFRGVGKSTLVLRALDQIMADSTPDRIVLPVILSVARSTTTERLLFAVVRRVFETLRDSGALDQLSPPTRRALLVAYMRTSMSFKETQTEARERSGEVNLAPGAGKGLKAALDLVVPGVSMSAKRSHSLATEAAFLAYSETDAEYDLTRIVSLVGQQPNPAAARWSRLRRIWPWTRPPPASLHLIIILDEVDKLTADAAGLATVEDLLSGIKNILTMPGAHFIVVAGPDLHDRALRDAARGNSIYESVFSWNTYAPCSWDAPDLLVAGIADTDARAEQAAMALLVRYLRFKARGVPRRLLQEVNRFVVWDADAPRIQVGEEDLDRVEFYARLDDILHGYFESDDRGPLLGIPIDEDRWRLACYYVVDWVLESKGEPFSAADLLLEGQDSDFDPLLRISRRNVDRLLDHLADHKILDVVREMNAQATVYPDIAETRDKVFRLAARVRQLLFRFAAKSELERAAAGVSLALPQMPSAAMILDGRYILNDLLGQGGIGVVYKGKDAATGRQVAVKLLRPSLAKDPAAVERIRREARLIKGLNHPQIVRTYDVVEGTEHSPAIVMELLLGPTMGEAVERDGAMRPAEAAAIGCVLAEALEYAASQQIVRLGLKPDNIIMASRGPVIRDLGVAREVDADSDLSQTGQFVGTPAYMAPELIEGRRGDARSDQYALALIVYYCLAGISPWAGIQSPLAIIAAVLNERVELSGLPISEEFRTALSRALERDPNHRFPGTAEFRNALKSTPEWRSLTGDSGSSSSADASPRRSVPASAPTIIAARPHGTGVP